MYNGIFFMLNVPRTCNMEYSIIFVCCNNSEQVRAGCSFKKRKSRVLDALCHWLLIKCDQYNARQTVRVNIPYGCEAEVLLIRMMSWAVPVCYS